MYRYSSLVLPLFFFFEYVLLCLPPSKDSHACLVLDVAFRKPRLTATHASFCSIMAFVDLLGDVSRTPFRARKTRAIMNEHCMHSGISAIYYFQAHCVDVQID